MKVLPDLENLIVTRQVLPYMRRARRGRIVMMSSIGGKIAMPGASPYCASKFALRGWSESVRVELAPLGIDVLLVSPGPTGTQFWDHLVEQQGSIPWTTRMAMPVEKAAAQVVRAIARGRREIILGFRGRWFVRLGRWFPGLMDGIMRRMA